MRPYHPDTTLASWLTLVTRGKLARLGFATFQVAAAHMWLNFVADEPSLLHRAKSMNSNLARRPSAAISAARVELGCWRSLFNACCAIGVGFGPSYWLAIGFQPRHGLCGTIHDGSTGPCLSPGPKTPSNVHQQQQKSLSPATIATSTLPSV